MKDVIKLGIFAVHFALIFYTLFFIFQNKDRRATTRVVSFIAIAIIFDILATTFMMLGATGTYFTLHGILGYSGLFLMITYFILLMRYKLKFGSETEITKQLFNFSKVVYIWWLAAFITGALVSVFRH